jgi:tungstate transport system substrate-binding protein
MGLCSILAGMLASCTAQPTPAAQSTALPAVTAEVAAATVAPATAATSKPTSVPTAGPHAGKLILATTTSTQDSGLLDYLLPDFEKELGVKISVVAVGTGQALKLGEDGNADVLLVHDPAKEKAFMDAGHGTRREDVMHNDFVLIGPEADPAGIRGMQDAAEAMKAIAGAQVEFISRGDQSGTHSKELSLWKAAGIEPAGDWYVSAGQGMGEVLNMADEQQAYTLSDRSTYLARTQQGLKLVVLVEGDARLANPYGVIAVNPNKGPQIKEQLANQFIDWLVSVPTQKKIAAFGEEQFGQSLFFPDSAAWKAANP